jgi:hypothetical protein
MLQGIFGMEFFEMDQTTHRLTASPQIWIYFVTAAAAGIVTLYMYYFMAGLPKFQWKGRSGGDLKEDHVPYSLQRGYTDIEMNPIAPASFPKG